MSRKEIVIFGAGKIGKGLCADIFHKAGYHIIFLCHSLAQAKGMRDQGHYTIFQMLGDGNTREIPIDDFEAYSTVDEYEKCIEVFSRVNTCIAPLYPNAFEDLGGLIGDAVKRRVANGCNDTLDVIVAVNSIGADKAVRAFAEKKLTTKAEKEYFEAKVGTPLALPNRLGAAPTEEMLKKDPQCSCCGVSGKLPVGLDEFKGNPPEIEDIHLFTKMADRMAFKLWGVNMRHCIAAYLAQHKGYVSGQRVVDDPEIFQTCVMAGIESQYGFFKTFTITHEELFSDDTELKRTAIEGVHLLLENMDSIERIGGDPKRKLAPGERLAGPAVACAKYGKVPFYITKGIACAFMFRNDADKSAPEIQSFIAENGIDAAIIKYCGLDLTISYEKEVFELVKYHYHSMMNTDPKELI